MAIFRFKKKILFVVHSDEHTGAPTMACNLALALNRSKFYPIVVFPSFGPLSLKLKQGGIEVYELGIHRFNLDSVEPIANLILETRSGLVHVNSIEGYAGVLAARRARKPVVWNIREMLDSYPTQERESYLDMANRIACVSFACAEKVRPFVEPSKLAVIYNGISTNYFSEYVGASEAAGLLDRSSDKVVSMIGDFYPGKGHNFLLQAAKRVLEKHPETVFVLVGHDVDAEYKESLVDFCRAHNILDSVRFLRSQDDVRPVLDMSAVVVSPSLAESFGILLVEAMAMKKPIVATRVGGIPEVVIDGESGILVPPQDASSLAEAIIKLLQSTELAKRYCEAGFERVSSLFDISRMAHNFENLYLSLLFPTKFFYNFPAPRFELGEGKKVILLGYTSPEDIERLKEISLLLKEEEPNEKVIVAATPATLKAVVRTREFDGVISYLKGYTSASRIANVNKLWSFLSQIRGKRFDESLVVYGSFHSRRYFKYELISLFSRAKRRGYITRYSEKNILPSRWAHLKHIWRRLALGYLLVKYLIVGTALIFHIFFTLKDRLFPPTKESSS